jgi:hypothetical protein
MWRYYNANPLGKIQSDCFLRALSCATSKSWDYIYEKISNIAQSQGMMMDDREFVLNYLDTRYDRVPFKNGMTMTEVANLYSDHIVLITTKGHIICAKYRNDI